MSKTSRIILTIFLISVVIVIVGFQLVIAFWNGTFNFLFPKEIATYVSPNGKYTLVFEQLGDPDWPFGGADVRLTLKDQKGRIIERVSSKIYNDGASASKKSIRSVSWRDDVVVVVLQGDEMPDEEIIIPYN